MLTKSGPILFSFFLPAVAAEAAAAAAVVGGGRNNADFLVVQVRSFLSFFPSHKTASQSVSQTQERCTRTYVVEARGQLGRESEGRV